MALNFQHRTHASEMMDDFAITDTRLDGALDNLRLVNRLLGGYSATMGVLAPFMLSESRRVFRIVDLGTGAADFPEFLVSWAVRHELDVEVVAVDAHPGVIQRVTDDLDARLSPPFRKRIRLVEADALDLPFENQTFDVAIASMFMHHLETPEAVQLLRSMNRVARGVIVNDLHRHRIAYYSIEALCKTLPVSPMFKHDAPISVLRGFRKAELRDLAYKAGLSNAQVRWCWAFRWVLWSLPSSPPPADEA